jgi:hypothetical protein
MSFPSNNNSIGQGSGNEIARWQAGLDDERCRAILKALYDANAYSPRFALSARAIGKLTGLHHQVIKRLIRGDKGCRAKLMGLVAWLNGKGRRGARYWLTPEGAKVAELLSKGFRLGKATLTALATDRLRRKMAHLNGTPSENNMPSKDGFNLCSLTAVVPSKPVRKPLSPLAERLCRDYGIRWWVAEDLVARYSPLEIKAAIALREWRNGAIVNEAGFIIYSLREGYARRLAEAWLRKPQCARPTRKPPDEPDWDAIVAALRDALAPYGIRVDDAGRAVLPTYPLPLPPDPDEAIALLWRHGFLRDGNGQDADQDPADAPDQAPTDADALTDDAPTDRSPADDADDGDEALADPLTYPTDGDDGDDEDDDDGEPLPPPTCDLCGRSQGEPHPALNKGQFNNLMALSRLSDAFKHRFGLPEFGVICRGCYMTLCRTLIFGGQPDPADAPDQAPTAVGCPCLLQQLNPLQSHVAVGTWQFSVQKRDGFRSQQPHQCLSCCKLHFKTLLRLTPVTHDDPAGRGGIMEQCFQDRDVRAVAKRSKEQCCPRPTEGIRMTNFLAGNLKGFLTNSHLQRR